jgi:rhamnogalacturonyl hydrolase YesR
MLGFAMLQSVKIISIGIFGAMIFTGWHSPQKIGNESFTDWPKGTSPAEIGKRVAENYAARQFEYETNPKREVVIYPEAISEYGALIVAQLTGESNLHSRLVEKFARFLTPDAAPRVSPKGHVDYRVFGIVPLEIFIETRDEKFLAQGKSFADKQWEQITPDGITTEARYWIDDMFMITVLEVQAFRATGEAKYLDRAATTMSAYLARLQQPNGLFYHGTNAPFYWSRGNGWVAAGMTELLRSLPEKHPERARIMKSYRAMMAALLKCQGDDGLWRQLLDQPDAWPETSGSAMFDFALVTGVKNGWLNENVYGPAARKTWLGLVRDLDVEANLREVCVGTDKGQSREFYLQRPRESGNLHGQAPMLWTASALLR